MNSGIKAWDKLFYPGSNVMINKFNEKNKEQLIIKEQKNNAKVLAILNTDNNLSKFMNNEFNIDSLKKLHKFLLGDVYSWAGTFKEVALYKKQDILGGASVQYCEPMYLEDNINDVLWRMNNTKWESLSNDDKILKFADQFQYLWQCHPFNEGNTRTTSMFMKAFAKEKNIPIDFNKLFNNPKDLRNAFVLYSTGEADCKRAVFKYFRDSATYSDIEKPSLQIPEKYLNNINETKKEESKTIKINRASNDDMEMD